VVDTTPAGTGKCCAGSGPEAYLVVDVADGATQNLTCTRSITESFCDPHLDLLNAWAPPAPVCMIVLLMLHALKSG
jgi:hypothetical protein